MHSKIVLRNETPGDVRSITEVTIAAFETMAISQHTEQFIIEALRSSGVLTVSIVAELDGHVIGHIAISSLTISDGTRDWFGLGPLSVLQRYQRQGIGKALIHDGLSRLKVLSARGWLTCGASGLLQEIWLCEP